MGLGKILPGRQRLVLIVLIVEPRVGVLGLLSPQVGTCKVAFHNSLRPPFLLIRSVFIESKGGAAVKSKIVFGTAREQISQCD